MDKEKLYDKIEDYLTGALSEDEATAFAQEIAADEGLAAEVALHQGLAKVIGEEEDIDELKGHLSTIFEADRKQSATQRMLRPKYTRYLRLAAAVLILLVTGLVVSHYLGEHTKPTLDTVFAESISPPSSIDILPNLRSGSQQDPDYTAIQAELINLWEQVDQAYQTQTYDKALSYLDQVATIEVENFNTTSSGLSYYRGMVLLQQGDFAAAVASFENAQLGYTEEADWHRAILLLTKLDRPEEAFPLLENLASSGGTRAAAAAMLLEQFRE